MKKMKSEEYFDKLEIEIKKSYDVANKARSRGLDPVKEVEIPLARNLAEKCVGLISTIYPQIINCGISERILELEEKYGKLDPTVVFKIAEEVAREKFCKFKNQLEAIDAGIRVGFSYTTLGVVSSPIEGFTELKLGKTKEGKDYFIAYFSGPIRSAGTTASCIFLMLIDYIRELFGYAKYDPNDIEIKRYVTENHDYHERITNLQYFPSDEEMIYLAQNLPFQISGEPTEKLEVSNYKNLERVDTNFIRGGMCLIFSEGLAQKAAKGFRLYNRARANGIKATGFDFIEGYIELQKKKVVAKGELKVGVPTYMKDLVAGRPIFGHPSRSGAFRFRYGRSRVSGFSAVSIHPATMTISNDFIAVGTQLKIEKPTKGCAISICDSIEGPIVKLKNGSLKKLNTFEESKGIYKEIEEIVYFGDILFPLGDVINRNYDLVKPGYVEEWWKLELENVGQKVDDCFNINFEEAINFSRKYRIPLYPGYIYYWTQINYRQFLEFLRWLSFSRVDNGRIILPYSHIDREKFIEGKRALELLGIVHDVITENVLIQYNESLGLLTNLGINTEVLSESNYLIEKEINFLAEKVLGKNHTFSFGSGKEKDVLEVINSLSEFIIKDKAGDFIGSRMGRPEKAKLRKLTGSPHVLFPVGEEGGRFRSVQEACETGYVNAEFPIYYCEKCGKETIYAKCLDCGEKTRPKFYCKDCGVNYFENKCPNYSESEPGKHIVKGYSRRKVNINKYLKKISNSLKGVSMPKLIKGIRGTSSANHDIENLAKGILRANYGINVNKDGTVRYDMTELPLTHFKPKEIFVSIEKLISLGYTKDIEGKTLKSEEQVLELKPHDIILPSNVEAGDEKADEVFINITKFIDELLEKVYNLPRFYNVNNREDLAGHLGVCMAPHNCAGVISRIIGFSKTQGLLASPYMHAAMRRDCDGDEAAAMLLLDVLINFSKKYLPSHRGGTQDAPLVLNGRISPGEVDDQILDFEMVKNYPLELYQKAEKRLHSSEIEIEMVRQRLAKRVSPFENTYYTHETSDFNKGVLCSSYKKWPTMKEKVDAEMNLVCKIRCVDAADVARLIIERHFIRDIRGNLRKFSMQGFRCVKCNTKFRRPPLSGVCNCGGNIIFTISEGGIVKYLEPAINLIKSYDIPIYVKQNIELTKKYIESIFGREETKQVELGEWF